jgi:hypothetical protein
LYRVDYNLVLIVVWFCKLVLLVMKIMESEPVLITMVLTVEIIDAFHDP